MTTVRLEHLTKRYPDGTIGVEDITLRAEAGEFLAIVGPSGCGKSTLLRLIAGLEEVTSGEIYFGTERLTHRPPHERDVGMVFQNYALYPHMTVAENLSFPLRVRKVPRAERERRVRDIAALLGLNELLHRYPKQLSGGQQQRVAVGRALVRSPRVFLFDEPLSNLDAGLRAEMRIELAALQRRLGITTIYVTHDHTEAMTMGDRIAVLRNGRLVQVGTPHQLYTDPDDLFVAGFLGWPTINSLVGTVSVGVDGITFTARDAPLRLLLSDCHLRGGMARIGRQLESAILAVRPEHVQLVAVQDADTTATVEALEFVGHESILLLSIGGERIYARTRPQHAVPTGATVGVRFDRAHLLLFDTAGKRL